jgi:hypothetical protein
LLLCHAIGVFVLAAAGGAMGLQPNPMQQQQQQQPPQPPQLMAHDLQALLANPAMLSAAIIGAQQGSNAAAAGSMGFGSQAMGMQMGLPAAGVQLQIPSVPVPAVAAGAMPPGGAGYAFSAAVPPQMPQPPQPPQPPPGFAGFGMAGGEFVMPGQQQQGGGGFGGLMALQQQQSGFADEADDPYDPEHAD